MGSRCPRCGVQVGATSPFDSSPTRVANLPRNRPIAALGGRSWGSRCQCVEFLTGLEAHGLTRRDANFSPSAGIAPDSRLAGANAEHTEAAQLNAFSCCKSFFQALEYGVDRRFCLGTGQACALDHMMHDVLFNQSGHLSARLFSTVPRPTGLMVQHFESFVEQRH
jgi:hypothetical protein